MMYTILSAAYANPDSTAAILSTAEAGDVVASQADTPDLWAQMLQGAVSAFPTPSLAAYQKSARSRIDSDVDAVYFAVIGDRTTEYQQANNDATAFKNAGYLGTVPASVQCWATAKGWTAQQAADDILTTASNWLGAQQSMRANRLARKQDVTASTTLAGVDAAVSAWSTYIAGMRANLGL